VELKVDTSDIMNKDSSFFRNFDMVCLTDCPLKTQVAINNVCRKSNPNLAFFAANTFGYSASLFEDLNEYKYMLSEKRQDQQGNQVQHNVSKIETFPTLQMTLQTSWKEIVKSYGKRMNIANIYLMIQIIFAFVDLYGTVPTDSSADLSKILTLRDQRLKSEDLKTNEKLLSDDLVKSMVAVADCELCPVCSIFGAIIAQEMLKVISAKEAPLKNVVIYDAIQGLALVQSI